MTWQQNLSSPIFDKVRVPGSISLVRLIERICADHGTSIQNFKVTRSFRPSAQTLAIRRDVLIAARAAGISPSVVGRWFGHDDSQIVLQWHSEIAEESA